MRPSVIDSPPVQPVASSTSGTGSVRTMCDEVTASRDRRGLTPRVAALMVRTAAPARTRAVAGLGDDAVRPCARNARTRECS